MRLAYGLPDVSEEACRVRRGERGAMVLCAGVEHGDLRHHRVESFINEHNGALGTWQHGGCVDPEVNEMRLQVLDNLLDAKGLERTVERPEVRVVDLYQECRG